VAARNVERKMKGARMGDFDRMEVRSRISAKRLIDGGLAIFVIEAINHHRQGAGRRVRSPLVKKSLRVLVAS